MLASDAPPARRAAPDLARGRRAARGQAGDPLRVRRARPPHGARPRGAERRTGLQDGATAARRSSRSYRSGDGAAGWSPRRFRRRTEGGCSTAARTPSAWRRGRLRAGVRSALDGQHGDTEPWPAVSRRERSPRPPAPPERCGVQPRSSRRRSSWPRWGRGRPGSGRISTRTAVVSTGRRLVTRLVAGLASRPRDRDVRGVVSRADGRAGARRRWAGPRDEESVRMGERALVLSAEHELNASTFAARVAASTGARLARRRGGWHRHAERPKHGGMTDLRGGRFPRAGPGDRRGRRRFGHPLYPSGTRGRRPFSRRLAARARARRAARSRRCSRPRAR